MLFFGKKDKSRSFEEIVGSSVSEENDREKEDECIESISEESCSEDFEKKEKPSPKNYEFNFNVLSFFGWNEENTDKWLKKCAEVWSLIASMSWFLFGIITFAPVLFIADKVNVIFKDKKKSILCGILLYLSIILIFIVLISVRVKNTVQTT